MKTFTIAVLIALLLCAGAFAYWKLHHPHEEGPSPTEPSAKPAATDSLRPANAFVGHTEAVRSVAFSPDGKTLASAGDDQSVRLWDVETGELRNLLTVAGGPVTGVAFSPDSKTVAAARYDSKTASAIYVYAYENSKIGPILQTLQDPVNLVSSVAYSANGKMLMASVGPTVNVWDLASGSLKCKLEAGTNASGAISPDGKSILTGSTNENPLKLWSVETCGPLRTWEGHESGGPISIQFSADGRRAASAGYDNKLIIWNTATGAPMRSIPVPDGDTVAALRFSPDGLRIVGALLHELVVWNVETDGQRTIAFDAAHSLAVSADGKRLAAGGEQGKILVTPLGVVE